MRTLMIGGRTLPTFVAFVANLEKTKMSAYRRVQQWATFARVWHVYDCNWQNPFDSAKLICNYLQGYHKPIYSSASDCGDHVVLINCKYIALPGDEWKRRVYFHHTGYPGGATWTLAWDMHKKDPTMIMKKAVYNNLTKTLKRRIVYQRVFFYEDDKVPEEIMGNVTNQIRPLRLVPRTIKSYTKEEIENFPKIWDYPKDYVIK